MAVILQRRTKMLILFPLRVEHRIIRAAPVTDRSQLTSRYVSPLQSSVQMLIVRRERSCDDVRSIENLEIIESFERDSHFWPLE